MERVIGAVICSIVTIQSLPINNGFSVKFTALNPKQEVKQQPFEVLFAKIPQASDRKQFISKTYFPNTPELGTGCTSQVAKVVFPTESIGNTENDNTKETEKSWNFLNLPVMRQPYENYKVLVATAPPNMKINNQHGNESLVIYVVFSENGDNEQSPINIPSIYFVSQQHWETVNENYKAEPIIIIHNNRTVTGLKSKGVEKFVKFESKLLNTYENKITR